MKDKLNNLIGQRVRIQSLYIACYGTLQGRQEDNYYYVTVTDSLESCCIGFGLGDIYKIDESDQPVIITLR